MVDLETKNQKSSNISVLDKVISDLLERFSDNIISIYGIGSYFDNNLPSNWIKNDLDLVIIVKSLDNIPKQDWTDVRYEKKKINNHHIWLGFNTLEGFRDKAKFKSESFSNYKWSIIDLKYPDNSKLLKGQDIRDQLPDPTSLNFDYDDILSRSLYHLEKSLKEAIFSKNIQKSMKQFTKGVFKFAFYLCVYFDKDFCFTSIIKIADKIQQISKDKKINNIMLESVKYSIIFRSKNQFETDFKKLRNKFIIYVFSLIGKGKLHKRMKFDELLNFLNNSFNGFPHLVQMAKKVRNWYYSSKSNKL